MAHRPLDLGFLALGRARPGLRLLAWPGVAVWLHEHLLAERERWLLWLPVAMGTGIALYFALPREPPLWLGAAGLALVCVALLWLWWRLSDQQFRTCTPALLGLVVLLSGFTVGSLRTHLVEAPALERRAAYHLEATVLLVEDHIRGQRLTLGEVVIDGLEPEAAPAQIRVGVRTKEPAVVPGDRVRLRAMLMPPSPPVEPRGFDFARQAYFMQLGAVGYGLDQPALLMPAQSRSWSLALSALRQTIANEITGVVPGDAGAIAVALLTGLRGALSDKIWEEWAVTGIAHLLSISGLHLAIVAGTLFFSTRIVLALAPPLALRLPTKKIAALVALIGSFGYLLISGSPVPTQRSFIMTALMLLAVMVDRNPFSMRLVAFAAFVVLVREPDTLLGASFQMSFGAVLALIAVYEAGAAKRPPGASGLGWRLLLYVAGVALTTLVASAATTPFSIYHFGRFSTYGTLTNLLAVPLSAVWIMPLGMLGLLLIPLGLAGPCFALMGKGIDVIIVAAAFMADLPGAALDVPRPPPAALVATVVGGLWLCLWRTAWRRLGLIGIGLGIALGPMGERPDLLVDERGQVIGVRLDDGRLALSPWQADRWITEQWLRSAGQKQAAPWPEMGQANASGLSCDGLGCVVSREGRMVALARRPEALEEDCARADLVISYPRVERCPDGTPLIGPRALRRAQGLAVWIGRNRIETLSVREARGERPWVR